MGSDTIGSISIFLGKHFIGLLISVSVNTRLLTTIIRRCVSSVCCCCSCRAVSALKPSYPFLVCALRTRNTWKRGGKRSTSLWCSSRSSYTFWKKRVKTSDQMTNFVRAQKYCFSFFSICSVFPALELLFIIMEKNTFTSHPVDYKNIGSLNSQTMKNNEILNCLYAKQLFGLQSQKVNDGYI